MRIGRRLYGLAGWRNQARVDRCRYALGLLPRVARRPRHPADSLQPGPHRGCVIFSADLELAWGWHRARGVPDPLYRAVELGEQTRRNWQPLLALFDRHEVPVTWATVGHLLLPGCIPRDGRRHPEMRRPPYFEGPYWRYAEGDWYEGDPGTDTESDPAWYAPDLIRSILQSRNGHEVACHTFSHIDCTDAHCPPEVMDNELNECCRLASEWGLKLRSFVFPGNLPGNLASLKRCGFRAYRWHDAHELGYPALDGHGLWQVPGGVHCEKPPGWSAGAWIRALRRCVDRARETGAVLHLWFHPSCDWVNVESVLPAVLDHIARRRDGLWVTTMGGLVDALAAGTRAGWLERAPRGGACRQTR